MTPIKQVYNNFHGNISIDEAILLYDEICKYIIDIIQRDYVELHEAYIRGKHFQPIDLTPLDKLHKPTV